MKLNGWSWAWIYFSGLSIGALNWMASGKAYNGFVYYAIRAPPFFMLAIGSGVSLFLRGIDSNK